MGMLYLVRHGQASFGHEDYDQLSTLGQQQAQRLGQHLRQRFDAQGLAPDAVLMGGLRRHRQTWEGMAQGAGWTVTPQLWPQLNEYDSHALVQAIQAPALPPPGTPMTPEIYREHFRLLRLGLQAWMDGRSQPKNMPSYVDFAQGVQAVLDHVRRQGDGHVLVISSGGPISCALGLVLGLAPERTIDLNMRIRNTALTELVFNPKRHVLLSFNTLPHLDGLAHQDWITYA